ncbi:MAG TPA: hypothetical protein PLR25_30225, partial [Planctomycetaceae bacterium]|nr:hypothetical protein [Planctomycetaceae bacterium]
VLIIVRTDFILDTCCRPVDGNHVGGMVPLIQVGSPPNPTNTDCVPAIGENCQQSHSPFRRRESGNGTPGGTFESWFFTSGESDPDTDQDAVSL